MKLSTTLISSCLLLAGCQSADVVEQTSLPTQAKINSVSQLNVLPLKAPSEQTFSIAEGSQRYIIDGIESPVVFASLPLSSGALDITVTSLIASSAFAPYIAIIREDGSIIEQYELEEFNYLPARFHLGNRLELTFTFMPPSNSSDLMLVVYTKPKALKESVSVTHPAKLDAEARGNYLPEVKDIEVPFAETGKVVIAIASSEQSQSDLSQSSPATVTKESSAFYHDAITKAVRSNELKKAVSLLEEAESLGVEGARETFNNAVNSTASQ
ncbi:MalM family protein [Vibrio maritimus]|uniref:MalM family protein n=1 Tax=Vibrio maritimus TaxID=990268 RepID=UPI004068957C